MRCDLRVARCVAALTVALAAGGPVAADAQPATATGGPLFVRHANVLDPADGSVVRDATIEIRGRTIVRVSAGGAVPADVRVVDAGGRWVVPGLIDAHTHMASLDAARRALASGVTTARSASTPLFQDIALRELVNAGAIAGPDVLAAGVFVTPELGETVLADPRLAPLLTSGVRTPDQLRTLVRVNLDRGVDVLKTRGTERAGLEATDPRQQVYDEAQLRAVVEEAATRDVPVLIHAHGDEGAYAAVAAGARSIEHGTYLSDSTLRLMREKGAYLVPTLSTVADLMEPGGDYDTPLLRLRGRHMFPRVQETIRRAHALGVPIVTGADTQYGPQSETRIAHEVRRFAELGLSPLEALQTATTVAAALLRREDRIGRVVAGREADFIIVERNPLEDLRALEDPLVVVSNGIVAVNRLPFGLR
jgi:imidazolonepropionase-like amidohydrolase